AATARAVVRKIRDDSVWAVNLQDVKARIAELGNEIVGSTPEEFDRLIAPDIQKWAQVIREVKFRSSESRRTAGASRLTRPAARPYALGIKHPALTVRAPLGHVDRRIGLAVTIELDLADHAVVVDLRERRSDRLAIGRRAGRANRGGRDH
ncbi:MAG: hypothetical protein FJX66_14920, partial [Alphaproteobacteria bacterium]|nr:hypothetical protein [Alphaproteobacteria bacterium]